MAITWTKLWSASDDGLTFGGGDIGLIQGDIDSTGGDIRYDDTRFKIGALTRDMTAASGDVSYTGIGFIPKAIFFITYCAAIGVSWGFTDSTTPKNIYISGGTSPTYHQGGRCVEIYETYATKGQDADLKSMDSDGFTLTWTKIGVPAAGTAYTSYLALR